MQEVNQPAAIQPKQWETPRIEELDLGIDAIEGGPNGAFTDATLAFTS